MRRIRDVMRLRYAQGLSERQIAASLGLGKGTVGAYLTRAWVAGSQLTLTICSGPSSGNGAVALPSP